MPTFSNDPTHPLLEKLDNTEVIEVEAESGRSQPAHKHVNLTIIAIKIECFANRAHLGRFPLCFCHELGGGEKDGDCTDGVAKNQDGHS